MIQFTIIGVLALLLLLATTNAGSIQPPLGLAVHSNPNKQQRAQKLLRSLQTVTEWTQIGQDINGEAASDNAGWAVSLNGDGSRIAVAAPYNDAGGVDAGNVRVFEFTTSWVLLGQPLRGVTGAGIGQSVSLSGDGQTIAVGSFRLFPYSGYVQIYRLQTNRSWRLLKQLDGFGSRDRFGGSVSMNYDGTRVAIGAAYHEGTGVSRGKTGIYEQDSGTETTWNLIGGEIYGGAVGDKSGHSVALSADGTTVAIGEITADPTNRNDAGNTVVYRIRSSSDVWTQLGAGIPGIARGDQSGFSVAISLDGSVVAIGSPMHSSQANLAGMVRVFYYDPTTLAWRQAGTNIFPEAALVDGQFGISVSLTYDGSGLGIGEPNEEGVGNTGIYYYNSGANDWELDTTLSAGAVGDRYGYSVALSGNGARLAVGAYTADQAGADSGKTRVYEFQTSAYFLSVEGLEANFATGTAPEITLSYQGTAPATTAARTYSMTVGLPPCISNLFSSIVSASGDAITPVAPTGDVPQGESFQIVTQLDVDPDTIRQSGFFTDDVSTGEGNLAFCVDMRILEGNEQVMRHRAAATVEIDMGQDFSVTDLNLDTISRTETFEEVRDETQFNYRFSGYICDASGNEIATPPAVSPGDEVSVCLVANADEPVSVANARLVSFENSLGPPQLGVDLIDNLGNPIEGTGAVKTEPTAGVIRISAPTVPSLYEFVDSSGTRNDISQGASMEGIAVFVFPNRRGLQDGSQQLETTFSVKLDLAKPPERTTIPILPESSACVSYYHPVLMFMVTFGSVALACCLSH